MPQNDERFAFPLTRRDVLLAAGAGAVGIVLPGCGGGGGGHKSASVSAKPVAVSGTVAPGSLATSSGLTVVNVYQASAPVGATGAFTTMTSSVRVLPHFVQDSSGQLVAMTTSAPGSPLTVSAESTLQTVLFLTPGIMAQDPAEARQVVTKLQGQASYQAALAYLQTNLPVQPLQSLLVDSTLPGLLKACVADYMETGAKARDVQVGSPSDGFSVSVGSGALGSAKINLVNDAWRVIRVDRVTYDVEGTQLGAPTQPIANSLLDQQFFHMMNGKTPATVEQILEGGIAPTKATDVNPLDLSDIPTTEYWIQGPGSLVGDTPLPSGVDDYSNTTYLASLTYYLLAPIAFFVADTLMPLIGLFRQAFVMVVPNRNLFEEDLSAIVAAFGSGRSMEEIVDEVAVHVAAIFHTLTENGLWTDAGLEAAKQAGLELLLNRFNILLIGANFFAMALAWENYKPVSHITITSSATGGVTVK